MEILRNPSLYNLLDSEGIPYEDIHNKIIWMVENDPTALHETINYLENQAEIYKTEYMRIQKLKKQKEENVDMLKKEILSYLEQRGIKSIETNIGKISKRKTPAKVNIKDLSKIPEDCFKVERTPSLTKIKEAYKSGLLDESAVELTEGYSLVRK